MVAGARGQAGKVNHYRLAGAQVAGPGQLVLHAAIEGEVHRRRRHRIRSKILQQDLGLDGGIAATVCHPFKAGQAHIIRHDGNGSVGIEQ